MDKVNSNPAVIVISSHVARGSIGNRAISFALKSLGFRVWEIPTVILPWHPGHGRSTRLEYQTDAFSRFLADIADAPWLEEVGAVLTGYLANSEQVQEVAKLITKLKNLNPSITYFCDPVLGDDHDLYIAEQSANAIKQHLLPLSDVLTPNRFELSWLSGLQEATTQEQAVEQARQLEPEIILATSMQNSTDDQIGNIVCTQDHAWSCFHSQLDSVPKGTGDLTAGLFLANRLRNTSLPDSLTLTTSSVFEIVRRSIDCSSDELILETQSRSLISPAHKIPAVVI